LYRYGEAASGWALEADAVADMRAKLDASETRAAALEARVVGGRTSSRIQLTHPQL
jgi:hypothetical protein